MARRSTKRSRSRKLGQPKGQRCTRFKTVTDKRGRRVRRCANFSGVSKSRAKSGTKRSARRKGLGRVGQPTGQRCTRFKRVRGKGGKMVRRCASFSGAKRSGGRARARRR